MLRIRLILIVLLYLFQVCTSFPEVLIPPMNIDDPLPAIFASTNSDKSFTVSSNHTFQINTTNMNPDCTPECYLNCQAQFPDIVQEKYCIINVCKCEIITESTSLDNRGAISSGITMLHKRLSIESLKTDWSFLWKSIWFVIIMGMYELGLITYILYPNTYTKHLNKENYFDEVSPHLYQRLIVNEELNEDLDS